MSRSREERRLSVGVQRLERASTVFAALAVFFGLGLLAATSASWIDSRGDDVETPPTSVPSRTTTTVPTYDVDGDGDPEFAVIEGDALTVPPNTDDEGSLSPWLVFAGTVLAAAIGAAALVGVALLNRQGGEQLGRLEDRLAQFEQDRPVDHGQ